MPSSKLLSLVDSLIQDWLNSYESICFPGLPQTACPILFFGDIESNKPLMFTMGTNPSNVEFYDRGIAITPYRFLDVSKRYSSSELFKACCDYFKNNPYKKWFGSQRGSKNEGFINLLDASYYDNSSCEFQAVHIDLIPFPTLDKYRDFKQKASSKTLNNMQSIGTALVQELITEYKPHRIICIGNEACSQWLQPHRTFTMAGKNRKFFKGSILGVPSFGTSVYYPDSHGSTPQQWKQTILPLI